MWNALTTVRRASPKRVDLGGKLVEPRAELQVDVHADVRRLVGEEGERVLERRHAGATSRNSSSDSARTEPCAAPWLTSSR